mgnify:CR=1 FL=1
MNARKQSSGDASLGSGKLLAAIAVLAVAFVVLAAIPAVADDSDAAGATYYVDASKGDDTKDGTTAATAFKTIAQALDKDDNVSKIILMSDLELGNSSTTVTADAISISEAKTVEIDLNGHMINFITVNVTGGNYYAVKNAGNLTISDSSTESTGGIHVKGYPIGVIGNTGTLTINNGNFTNEISEKNGNGEQNVYYLINNTGTVDIKGGSFILDPKTAINSSIIKNGFYTDVKTKDVEQPTIIYGNNMGVSWDYSAEDHATATMNISGGVFKGSTYVKNDFGGVMTVSGGSFDTTGAANIFTYGKLTVSDGVFKCGNEPIWAYGNAEVSVTGGDFTQAVDSAVCVTTSDKSTYAVTLGLNNTKVSFTTAGITGVQNLVRFSSNYVATGEITIDGNKVTFEGIKAASPGLFIRAGSIEITGTMTATEANAKITQVSGDVVLKDLTITNGTLALDGAVTMKGTVTIDDGASLSVNKNAVVTVSGKLAGDGNVTNNGTINILTGGSTSTDVTGNEPTYTPDFVPMPPTEDDFPGYVPSQTVEKEKKDESTTQVAIVAAAIAVVLVAIIALLYKSR